MKPRIGIVTDMYDNSTNGAVISTRRFVAALEEDFDVRILATGSGGPNRTEVPAFEIPLVAKTMRRMEFSFGRPLPAKLREFVSSVDVVHIMFPFWLEHAALDEAERQGRPKVATFHLQPENMFYNVGIHAKMPIEKCYQFHVKRIYNRADMVICPSPFACETLIQHGLTAPAMVLSNGVLPQFRPLPEMTQGAADGKFMVVAVGRYGREKRQDLLLRAVGLSRNRERIQVVLVGKGPQQEALEALGSSLPNPPKMGYLSEEELIVTLNRANLCVHSSLVELESMSVLEALACGTPTLIADASTSAAPQFALDQRFLFVPDNAELLAERLDYWVEHSDELACLRSAAVNLATQYSFEKSARRLANLYSDLLGRGAQESQGVETQAHSLSRLLFN